jgi:hypothetical protein
MAGIRFTGHSGEVTIAGSTTQVILAVVAPTNQRVFVSEASVSAKNVDASQTPFTFELVRFTGTGGESDLTEDKLSSTDGETIQSVMKKTYNAAAETVQATVLSELVSPNGGGYTWGPGNSGVNIVKGGEKFGIRIKNNSGSAITVQGRMICEE